MGVITALFERYWARKFSGKCPPPGWDHYYSMPPAELVSMIERGDGKAAFVLGDIYDAGMNGVDRNLGKALQLYRLGETRNDPDALNNIGSMYHHGDGLPADLNIARQYYERGVAGGCAASLNNLGRMYLAGEGGLKADPKRAIALLAQGAGLYNADAALKLAGLYRDGEHVRRSARKRVYWAWRAAYNGSPIGYRILGTMYAAGDEGLNRNYERAVELFRLGAAQCDSTCTFMLGVAYYTGQGAPKDVAEAWKFMSTARCLGDEDAEAYLKKIAEDHPESTFGSA